MIELALVLALAVVLVVCAVAVVVTRNLVHSVFSLAATLLVTAVIYVALEAPFLAGIQVLLYTGGVITMMLFGVMLTQRDPNTIVPNPVARPVTAGIASFALLVTLLTAIWGTPELAQLGATPSGSAADVGKAFLGPHLIAFELLSVLLLAAMIGAIVLARKGDA